MRDAVRERSWLLRSLHRKRAMAWGSDPAAFDPLAVEQTLEWVGKLFGEHRYFRLDARGLENVPRAPAMIVSNHSGGTTIPDVWGFAVAWYRHFGLRPLHFMTHEIILATDVTGEYFARRGALRASTAMAREALARFGRDVMVMPGGDVDAWRPHRDRYRVEFAGRIGYARLALELGVPIVPVANAGPHETLWVLSDGRRIARAIGLHKIARAEIWPVHMSIPWGLAIGPWPHLPLPTTFRYRVGEPITPRGDARDLDARVRGAVQRLLDDLASEKKHARRL